MSSKLVAAERDCKFRILTVHKENLELLLMNTDVVKLSVEFFRHKVITRELKDKLASLDNDHLEPDIKVRYLLQQVCERVREDDKVYDRLVKALSRHEGSVKGVCEAMKKELEGGKASGGAEAGPDQNLYECDISHLTEMLVSGSYLWEEIGIALNLPKHKRISCGKGESDVVRLSNTLTAWILGGPDGTRPTTLCTLRTALGSATVDLGKLAQKLCKMEGSTQCLPVQREKYLANEPEVNYQSCDTEVAEGKSTLLEVQVSSNGCESYQWSKDGQPLLDGADFSGLSSNMLYINRASQGTEGKYSCCVSNGSETVCSDEINLMVIYPPEKEHLMKLYSLMESEVPTDSWPPVSNSTFINLVLIKRSPISRCDYYTVRGDMDDVLESKEVVEYEEVFREYREGALVLVEGRPGSGKTTLVHKVTRDWARGEKVLQGAKMVFLITLRLLNFSGRDRSLLDILEVFYGGEALRKKIEHDLQECGGKGACFIIDGLDEYQHKNKKESVIYQLIYKQCLHFSMVIVASRPVATDEVKKCSGKRIEVIGFTKSQIYDYVQTYPFSGSDKVLSDMVSTLMLYLDQHPNILHMCYLPVHAAMICFLFSQLEGNIPHTETQIYEQFTISTLLRQRARGEELKQLKCFKDLCGMEKEEFRLICKLAFDMIMNSQQVVSQSDAQVSLSDFNSSFLGLLTLERSYRQYGVEHLYSFHHLTFQEFLAALRIAELSQHEQKDIIINCRNDCTMQNVVKFFCGLMALGDSKVLLKNEEFIRNLLGDVNVISPYKIQCAFESQQVELCDYVLGNGSVYLRGCFITAFDFAALGCVISTASQHVCNLSFHRCTWDDGVMALSSIITRNDLNSIKRLRVTYNSSDDMCKDLNSLLIQIPFLEELDFQYSTTGRFDIECLTSDITLPKLTVLRIGLPLAPCSHPEQVLKRLTFNSHRIRQVYIYMDGVGIYNALWKKWLCYACGFQVFQDSDISWVHLYNSDEFSSLPHERFSYCSEVVLVNCGIDDEGAEILANSLNTSVLEKLVLDFSRISDSGAVALAGCIARCSVVQEVSIQCNSIGDSGAIALADALVHCSSLRRLDLQGNGLGNEGAVAIAKAAEGLPNLDLYLHNVNITEEGVERVLEHRASTKLRAMVFGSSWDAISDAGIDALRSALKCGTLPALKISSTSINNIEILVGELEHVRNIRGLECDWVTDDMVPILCGIVKSMKNLQHINFMNIYRVSSTSAQLLCNTLRTCKLLLNVSLRGDKSVVLEVVKYCTNLYALDMSYCYINSDGVTSLFNNRKSWVNLHTLNLYDNKIGSDGAHVLSKVLVHCKNLRYLDLSSNDLGDSGCLSLAEGLQNHTSLLELKLGWNDITSEGIAALIQVIRHSHLQHMDISGCRLGSKYVATLMDAMCRDTLQRLELSCNQFGLDGAKSLSVGLQNCSQLVELHISGNNIGSQGMSSLAEGLKSCRQLLELNISNNNIGSQGMSSLAEGLKKCGQLIKLQISHNNISTYGISSLTEGLQYCTNLQMLGLSYNNITSDGVTAMVNVMERCRYLQQLDLGGNSIGVDGAAVLVGGWQHKSMLTLVFQESLGDPHESALLNVERCCGSCDHLLELYYYNDYVIISFMYVYIPKLVSSSRIIG